MNTKIIATKEEKELADYIHNKHCGYSHTDQCSYDYRSWDNPGSSYDRKMRTDALELARNAIEKYGIDAINNARNIMKDI